MNNKLPTKSVVDMFYTHIKPHLPGPSKPILINLHGFLGSKTMFHSVNRSISKTLNTDIYTLDLRNHGDSPQAHPMTYDAFVNDLRHFIHTKLPQDRPIDFIGYSLGGKVAMALALKDDQIRQRIRKIVSIDMPPYATPTLPVELTNNFDLIKRIDSEQIKIKTGGIQWRNKVIDMLGFYFGAGFLQNNLNYTTEKNKFIKFYLPLGDFPNVVEEIKSWPIERNSMVNDTIQVLFLRGMKSCLIESNYDLLYHTFAKSMVEEYNTSHNLIFEEFDKSINSITKFLQ